MFILKNNQLSRSCPQGATPFTGGSRMLPGKSWGGGKKEKSCFEQKNATAAADDDDDDDDDAG